MASAGLSGFNSGSFDPFGDGSGKALYKLEGNALDDSGVYNGTATNITYATGINGQCGVFSGTNSKVYGLPVIQRTSNPSFSFWFKPVSLGVVTMFFIARASPTSNGYGIYFNASNRLAFTHYTVADYTTNVVSAISNTSWSHIAFVCRTGFVDVYVNGSLFQTLTTGGYVASTAPFAHIGFDPFQSSLAINASIDQLRIFNRSLTQAEVTQLYNAGA
jgi:hypothetical protein